MDGPTHSAPVDRDGSSQDGFLINPGQGQQHVDTAPCKDVRDRLDTSWEGERAWTSVRSRRSHSSLGSFAGVGTGGPAGGHHGPDRIALCLLASGNRYSSSSVEEDSASVSLATLVTAASPSSGT